jgi:crotonobetainyl-CoA:carnitine CoA-transferase CaiB-like acyl-CoA transferase
MEDHWVAIHAETDDQWQAMVRVLGSPAWALDPRFATNEGRAAHFRELDAHIAAWTSGREDYDVMHALQQAGVAAAPVLEASRAFDDPHLRSRGFFRSQRVENGNTYEFVGPLWKFPDTPVEFYQGPVAFGEHNDYVYREVLKVGDDELAALRAGGHIATEFDGSVL